MPAGATLKNRLTLWSFILLVIITGTGGFFCYQTQHRELFDQLDSQLLSLARNFACGYREIPPPGPDREGFCQNFHRRAIYQGVEQAVYLYSVRGEVLCSNRHHPDSQQGLTRDAEASSEAGRPYFETNTVDNQQARLLTFPIVSNDEVRYHLKIEEPLNKLDSELNQYGITVALSGLIFVSFLVFCQWLILGLLSDPLSKISRLMDRTNENNLNEAFTLPPVSGPELEQLVDSYQKLRERLGGVLQRSRQFSTDLTHELRTPLTILRGETELALRGEKSADQLREVLSSNLEEVARMGHLVEDLLLLSKSDMGEIPLNMSAINLNEMLEELSQHGAIIAEPKRIKVELQAQDRPVSLLGDANRLRQVFLNLLTNGIKYTPEGGTVTINWSVQGEMVRILFQDTGIGIDTEHQQHIFDRFYRINKTLNSGDGGSGLGLAIAKWLIEAHGGSIMVCSVPGHGSSFAIMLPLTCKTDNNPKLTNRKTSN